MNKNKYVMHLKKSWLFFALLLLTVINVNALDISDVSYYYSIDNDNRSGNTIYDLDGNVDATASSVTLGATGKLEEAGNFANTNNYIDTNSAITTGTNGFSIAWWFNADTWNNAPMHFQWDDAGSNRIAYAQQLNSAGNQLRLAKLGSTVASVYIDGITTGTWYHIVMTVDSSGNLKGYVNGQLNGSASGSNVNSKSVKNRIGHHIGLSANYNYDGLIDEFAMFNKVLNSLEVEQLYNNGDGLAYPFTLANDEITLNSIKANNETFVNDSWFSTTNILFDLNLSVTDGGSNPNTTIFVYKNNSLYYTETINNDLTPSFNVTNFTDSGSRYNISWYSINNVSNSTFGNYSIIVDLTPPTINNTLPLAWPSYNINLSNYISCYDIESGTCNITFLLDGVSVPTNTTSYNFTYNGNQTYDIIAEDTAGNTVNESGYIFVNPIQLFNFYAVNGSQITNYTFDGTNYNTTAQIPLYDYGLGNHTVLFEKVGFGSTNITFEFTNTSGLNSSFNISFAEIIINIFDGETNNLITSNVSITLVGTGGTTKTTTSGSVSYIGQNLGGEYSLTASSSGYDNENYYFTFSNQEVKNISIYMLNENTSEQFTFQCKGPFSDNLVGATLKSTRWDSSTSQYVIYSMDNTDSNGQGTLNLEIGTYYIVMCEYEDRLGTLPSATYSTLDAQNVIPITVPLSTTATEFNQVLLPTIASNITADYSSTSPSTQAYFELTFNDPSEEATKHCLKIYTYNGVYQNQFGFDESTDCSSNPTGVIVKTFNYTNGTNYLAKYYVTVNGKEYFQASETFDTSANLENQTWIGFLLIVFILLGIYFGYSQNFMELGITAVIMFFWIFHWAGWFLTGNYGLEALIGFTFMGILAIWGVNKLK